MRLRAFRLAFVSICLALLSIGASRYRAVRPVPSTLTAYPDSYSVGQGKALVISSARGPLANDRDPQNRPLVAVLVTNPIHGTLTFNPDGSFTYTNDGTGASSDFFSYQASNGNARSNIAVITITIGAADVVVANPETYSVSHGASITVGAP